MASQDQNFLFLLAADWPRTSRLVAFVIGCASTATFAPAEFALLAPIALLPMLFISMTVSPKDAGAHFFWFGCGLFLTGTYWIYISVHVVGHAALWIAILLMICLSAFMAMFFRIAGWLTSRLSHSEPWRLLLVAPAAWVLMEWSRGWVLTGFPWLALGYSQIDSPLAGWAPVLGVYGVSFMLMVSTAAILTAMMTTGTQRVVALLVVVLPWAGGGVLGAVNWTEPYGDTIRATIVQRGTSQTEKWSVEQRQPTLDFYRAATLSVPESDLVVWPEVAIPALNDQVTSYLDIVDRDAQRNQQTVLLGILERSYERSKEGRIYNSVLLLGASERQTYRKRHLVPFGEYFPVPSTVREWMRLQNLPHSDLTAGKDVQTLLAMANGVRLAVAICYEDVFGSELLYAFPEAGLMINVSNDAWFGDSIAPHQHLQIARMRALEIGRYVVRATNDGISAFIGPAGELLDTGNQFEPVIMTADLRAHRGSTVYVRYGNWPIVWVCFLILGVFWIRSRAGL